MVVCLIKEKPPQSKTNVKEVNVLGRKAVEGSSRNKSGNYMEEQRTQARVQRGKHRSQE